MSSDKRLVLTMVLCFASMYGIHYAMEKAGWGPPAAAPVAKGDAANDAKGPDRDKGKGEAKKAVVAAKPPGELPDNVFAPDEPAVAAPAPEPAAKASRVAVVPASELVLGSDDEGSPYNLRLQLDQKGAAVAVATSTRYDAEIDPKGPKPKAGVRRPRLKLIDEVGFDAPGSLSLTVAPAGRDRVALPDEKDDAALAPKGDVEAALDLATWEVVRTVAGAPAVRPLKKTDPATNAVVEGQEIAFRTSSASPAVDVTKTYRLWKGKDEFEVELRFSSPKTESKVAYRLFGPHGIPIEGRWYTSTFRDVFFGATGTDKVTTHASTDIVKYKGDPSYRLSTLPLKYAGVENQYFATFVQPYPIPTGEDDRVDAEAGPVVFQEDRKEPQFSDVGVEIVSKPLALGPNLGEVVHTYRVYAGPKIASELAPFGADELAKYRKSWVPIPYASELAKYVIAPLLDKIYALTKSIANLVGWKNGNYGIAIILLTMTVRLIMFPLGRKQAMMAKKMQDLQPILAELKEKYKDDKEGFARAQMGVWKQYKVNPAAGCIPALIQMPIFVGLWQSLNNSVALRHSTFLYIRDLAAPDMLFTFPVTLPLLGDYFNLLPFLVVSLMLVQTKLFAPPPTTPEAEMNQKMMKYMMIVMAFMFYKVPSGLGLYFITSSLWQIGERLLLPKVIGNVQLKPPAEDEFGDRDRGQGPNGKGPGPNGNGNGPQGWLGRKLEKILEEAAKDGTHRNVGNDRDRGRSPGGPGRDRDRDRDRERPRARPKPGKRR